MKVKVVKLLEDNDGSRLPENILGRTFDAYKTNTGGMWIITEEYDDLYVMTGEYEIVEDNENKFEPTHIHIKSGGKYEYLGELIIKTEPLDNIVGVRYKNEDGEEFVRTRTNWLESFKHI